jgi:hypothetical protein
MYLNLGSDMAVRDETLIGIFDLDTVSFSKHTKAFLARCERDGAVVTVAEDIPRSVVLTAEYGMEKLYLTAPTSRALAGRLGMAK